MPGAAKTPSPGRGDVQLDRVSWRDEPFCRLPHGGSALREGKLKPFGRDRARARRGCLSGCKGERCSAAEASYYLLVYTEFQRQSARLGIDLFCPGVLGAFRSLFCTQSGEQLLKAAKHPIFCWKSQIPKVRLPLPRPPPPMHFYT